MTETTHTFTSDEERDKFLTANYPERQCTDVPGLYAVNGGSLGIGRRFSLDTSVCEVTFYPKSILRQIIETAASAYEIDGAWDDLIFDDCTRNTEPSGDTLADFVLLELHETNEPTADRQEQIEEAIRVMTNGWNDLGRVVSALEAMRDAL